MKSPYLNDRVLVRLFKQFKSADLKGMQAYLECPLFNKDPNLSLVFDRIQSQLLPSRTKKVLPGAFVAGTKLNESQLNKSFSALYTHATDYLEMQERRKVPEERYRYLFQALERLGVEDGIREKEYKRALKSLGQGKGQGEQLLLEFQVRYEMGKHKPLQPRNREDDFLDVNQGLLDQYYLLEKLKYLCATYNLERIYHRERTEHFEQAFYELCRIAEPTMNPVAHAYWLVWQAYLFAKREEELIARLYAYLEEYGHELPQEEGQELYNYLLNLCMPGVDMGSEFHEGIVDKTYLKLLKSGDLLNEGKLSPFHFKNIVSFRLRLGKMEWVGTFIAKYGPLLANDLGGRLVDFAQAYLDYYRGHKRKAIAGFQAFIIEGNEDVFLAVDARNMIWKSYFDLYQELTLEEFEEMERLYDSYRLYVSRNDKISAAVKGSRQNFIRIFNKLLALLNKGEESMQEYENLLLEVDQLDHFVNKKWLQGAIAQFLKVNRTTLSDQEITG